LGAGSGVAGELTAGGGSHKKKYNGAACCRFGGARKAKCGKLCCRDQLER